MLGSYFILEWARGGALGSDTALQSRKVAGSIPDGMTGIVHHVNAQNSLKNGLNHFNAALFEPPKKGNRPLRQKFPAKVSTL